MSKAHFRQVRRILYSLKRRYPQSVGLYRSENDAVNLQTGVQTQTVFNITIKRAILLPTSLKRPESPVSISGYNYGALYDKDTRRIIVSPRDLPSSWILDLDNWLVVQHKRWELKEIIEFEDGEGIMFVATTLTSQPPKEIHDQVVQNNLSLTDSVTSAVL